MKIFKAIREIFAFNRFKRQLTLFLLPLVVILVVILFYPYEQGATAQAETLKILGLIISAVVALASTSFVANLMSGFMLRLVRNFDKLDWIAVEDKFGRVTERGLFHVEIETEESALITLPNLYLVTRPVKVIKKAETIISISLSLGYDIPRAKVEEVLKLAVRKLSDGKEDVELENPLVHILDLGDCAINYRVSALLKNVNKLITVRSLLRCYIVDELHAAKIEIISPAFSNNREVPPQKQFIPPKHVAKTTSAETPAEKDLEDVSQSKSIRIGKLQDFRDKQEALEAEAQELKDQLKDADENSAAALEKEIATLEHRISRIASTIDAATEEKE